MHLKCTQHAVHVTKFHEAWNMHCMSACILHCMFLHVLNMQCRNFRKICDPKMHPTCTRHAPNMHHKMHNMHCMLEEKKNHHFSHVQRTRHLGACYNMHFNLGQLFMPPKHAPNMHPTCTQHASNMHCMLIRNMQLVKPHFYWNNDN